jgi:hypothetical protein
MPLLLLFENPQSVNAKRSVVIAARGSAGYEQRSCPPASDERLGARNAPRPSPTDERLTTADLLFSIQKSQIELCFLSRTRNPAIHQRSSAKSAAGSSLLNSEIRIQK